MNRSNFVWNPHDMHAWSHESFSSTTESAMHMFQNSAQNQRYYYDYQSQFQRYRYAQTEQYQFERHGSTIRNSNLNHPSSEPSVSCQRCGGFHPVQAPCPALSMQARRPSTDLYYSMQNHPLSDHGAWHPSQVAAMEMRHNIPPSDEHWVATQANDFLSYGTEDEAAWEDHEARFPPPRHTGSVNLFQQRRWNTNTRRTRNLPPQQTRNLPPRQTRNLPPRHQRQLPPRLRNMPEDGVAISDVIDVFDEVLAASFNEAIQLGGKGLSEEAISSCLKIRTHVSPAEDQETEVCTICLDGYEVEKKIGTLDCGHEYHEDCIKQWLLVKNTCPICRKKIEEFREGSRSSCSQ